MKRIRGHHIFCMTLFSGHGYDERFSENMKEIIKGLTGGEEAELCKTPDDICAACPNLQKDGGCRLGTENVKERDKAAFSVLGFKPGETVTRKEIGERVACISEEDFNRVCGGCRWKKEGLCTYLMLKSEEKKL